MVHILLVILKFIGILLASILGFLLFLFLVILFAPVGYRAEGEAGKEKIRLQAGVSWLFVILRGKVVYEETGLLWYFRVCGVLVASNEKEFQERKAERARKKKEKKEKKALKKAESPKQTEEPKQPEAPKQLEPPKQPEAPKQQEPPKQAEPPKSIVKSEIKKNPNPQEKTTQVNCEEDTKASWNEKLLRWKEKLLSLKNKGLDFYGKWKAKLSGIPVKIKAFRENWEEKMERLAEIRQFWQEEQTQEVKDRLIRDGKKMALHVLPKKFQGHIEFGLEDPYQMGQVLAVLGILMPLYQEHLTVQPDFEEPKLCGSISLKGRIIPGYLLIKAGILVFNKKIRNTIKEGKKLIGGKKNGRKK